jgi:type IV secretory pathway VirB10-like protein
MNFSLEKNSDTSDSHLSRFRVKNGRGDTVGHINVNPEEESDLRDHWLGSAPAAPRATAPRAPAPAPPTPAAKRNPVLAAMVAHKQQQGATSRNAAGKETAAISAMLKAAKKQRPLSQEAVLRGC